MKLLHCVRRALLVTGLWASVAAQAALLGVTTSDPALDVAAGGVIRYNATTGVVTISGIPLTLNRADPFIFGEFIGTGVDDEKLFSIQFKVNSQGQLVSGVDGADLIIKGGIDIDGDGVIDYEGVLLEAEVTAFGFEQGANGSNTRFDVRLGTATGPMAVLYAGKGLAVVVDSEPSPDYPTPFNGGFSSDFMGQSKAAMGAEDPPQTAACTLKVDAFCSVGNDPRRTVCRVPVTRSAMHWEHVTHYAGPNMFRMYRYGMHGDPVPSWASRYAATNVKFTYVVTNTGTVPVSALQVIDSFDTPLTGVPATLAAGQAVTITRTAPLRDAMIDNVVVSAQSGSAVCMARDSVVVKDKVRTKRMHDNDKYKDKDDREDRR